MGEERRTVLTLIQVSGKGVACERRRISGCRSSPPKNDVCELESANDFSEVGILSQSQFSSSSPRITTRGIRCEEHSSFILSWNLIGQGETKVITSQKSFPGSSLQTLFLAETSDSRNMSTFAGYRTIGEPKSLQGG